MHTTTTTRPARGATLSAAQLRELRAELERERGRFADTDPRHHSISNALQRMVEGDYGTCVHCHERIPYARLAAMPETTFCLGCRS